MYVCLRYTIYNYPSLLTILEDISLLSFEFEYVSDIPGEDGPLLFDRKLGGPLQPTPKNMYNMYLNLYIYGYKASYYIYVIQLFVV